MDGRSKTIRLCLVFAFGGVLTVMCLARTGASLPANINHYLDIIMAVLMIVLMLCVLELCLGVEICGISHSFQSRNLSTDLEEGRGAGDLGIPVLEPPEAPPSYEVIMAERRQAVQRGKRAGGRRARKTSESLKRDLCVYSRRHVSESDAGAFPPPVPPCMSLGGSETSSFMSTNELWLSVNSLPTYEEALGRLREKEAMLRVQDPVARMQDEEIMTWLREEALVRLEEQVVMRMQQQQQQQQQKEQEEEGEEMTVIHHQEEEEEEEEEEDATARLKDDGLR